MTETARQLDSGALDAMHLRRMRRMLLLGSAIVLAFGLYWGIYFALHDIWPMTALDAVIVSLGVATVRLSRHGRLRSASFLLIGVLFMLLCFGALVLDIPNAAAPRSIHAFFLSLGVASCVLMRDESPWLRHGVPMVFLLGFAFFACTPFGWEASYALPDSVRVSGVWINYGLALIMLYASLHVIQTDVAERSRMEIELRDAMARGEMLLHYQPQVAQDEGVVGAEALLRWVHPLRGMIAPNDFIPFAERTGLIHPLGDWVLRTGCRQLTVWSRRPETASIRLAVNVSACQFAQSDFVTRVLDIVRQTGANPLRLKLELTESMLAHDVDDIVAKMKALKACGIGFSLDDFGTGFSSLAYLGRLPLDQLKIDQSFVRKMLSSPQDSAIARSVVDLGNSLGFEVIAEGVESQEQLSFLSGMGCRMFQGYFFSRPVPVAEFDAFVERNAQVRGAAAAAGSPIVRGTPDSDDFASEGAVGSAAVSGFQAGPKAARFDAT